MLLAMCRPAARWLPDDVTCVAPTSVTSPQVQDVVFTFDVPMTVEATPSSWVDALGQHPSGWSQPTADSLDVSYDDPITFPVSVPADDSTVHDASGNTVCPGDYLPL